MAIQKKKEKKQKLAPSRKKAAKANRRDRQFVANYKQLVQAAEQGKKWAFAQLGAHAEFQGDYMRAIEQYEKLAVQGDIYYMRRIAIIYEQSLEDINSAIDWYAEAGHYGDEYSMIRAGNLLEFHFEDFEEAILWYRKASNNLIAIYHMCRIYQHNLQDFDTTVECYKQAIQMGDSRAAVALGQMYENALEDYSKAVEWYSFAASHKNLYAINLLCQLYENKLYDYPKAIEWYKKAMALYNEQNESNQITAADPQAQKSIDSLPPQEPEENEDLYDEDLLPTMESLTEIERNDVAEIEFLN